MWIDTNFPNLFPWVHPDHPAPEPSITGIIVHMLPGLYGPTGIPNEPDIDPESGIPYNGEVWPAIVRDNVSLQGTSALDTILDGRYQFTHILEVADVRRGAATDDQQAYRRTFIDSLTIRRARANDDGAARGEGAGIYIHPRGVNDAPLASCRIWITNNFIVDNVVGIGLDSYANEQVGVPQRPSIVNNTIAWNGTGLWCGSLAPGFPGGLFSIHAALIVNNIFDSASPSGAYYQGISGFEGVHPEDKQVATRGGVLVGAAGVGIDFNAWEGAQNPNPPNNRLFVNLGNLGVGGGGLIAPNWPETSATNTTVFDMNPRVDLTPFTRGVGGRGSLYINDILRNSPLGGVGGEYSAHDFRLAPNVSVNANAPGTVVPPALNPLVNQGIDGTNGGFPIVILGAGANRSIAAPGPGLPADAEETVVHG